MAPIPKHCRQQSRFLPAFALLLVAEEPMHGGAVQAELKRRLPEMKADSAAVYRALTGLEKNGELRSRWYTKDSGPAIRIYEPTAAGLKKLDEWFDEVNCRLGTLNYFVKAYGRLKKKRRAV